MSSKVLCPVFVKHIQKRGGAKLVISRHIKNLFKEGELDSKRVVAKNATTASDGKHLIYCI
ncbi:MAG: hypothetical protein E7178_06420 [Erysipelotrichaceae bacterium]|nr:hypothetical protein [Erysipelotrichaceae bacterium]